MLHTKVSLTTKLVPYWFETIFAQRQQAAEELESRAVQEAEERTRRWREAGALGGGNPLPSVDEGNKVSDFSCSQEIPSMPSP